MTDYKPGENRPDQLGVDSDDKLAQANTHRNAPEPIGVYDRPARNMPSTTVLLIGLLVLLALAYIAYIALF